MYRNKITLKPDTPNFPLKPVWVGTSSGALFLFDGIPEAAESVRLYITKAGAAEPVYFEGSFDEATGQWTAYAGGGNFQAAGQGSYEVEFVTEGPQYYWCGRGLLTVTAASGGGSGGTGTLADQYVRDPITGLYYKVVIATNELGQKLLDIDQEGVSLA